MDYNPKFCLNVTLTPPHFIKL